MECLEIASTPLAPPMEVNLFEQSYDVIGKHKRLVLGGLVTAGALYLSKGKMAEFMGSAAEAPRHLESMLPVGNLVKEIEAGTGPTLIKGSFSALTFDETGKLSTINVARTDSMMAKGDLLSAAGYARLSETDPFFAEAAQSMRNRFGMTISSPAGLSAKVAAGAMSFVRGERGNGYTKALTQQFGKHSQTEREWLALVTVNRLHI